MFEACYGYSNVEKDYYFKKQKYSIRIHLFITSPLSQMRAYMLKNGL